MYSEGLGCCGSSPVLGAWWAAIPAVIKTYQTITGGDSGGHCWTRYGNRPFSEPCPNTPNYDAVIRAVTRAPQADILQIVNYLLTTNQGSGPRTREELQRPECVPFWVKALMGGKGCVASTYPEAPGWFLDFVQTYGAPETPAQEQPGSAIPPGFKPAANLAPIVAGGLALVFLPKLFGKGR